jgi:hypothetical protein
MSLIQLHTIDTDKKCVDNFYFYFFVYFVVYANAKKLQVR